MIDPSSIPGRYLQPDGSPIRLPVPPSGFQLQQGGKSSAAAYQFLWRPLFDNLTDIQENRARVRCPLRGWRASELLG
jgi:hypothetical protein